MESAKIPTTITTQPKPSVNDKPTFEEQFSEEHNMNDKLEGEVIEEEAKIEERRRRDDCCYVMCCDETDYFFLCHYLLWMYHCLGDCCDGCGSGEVGESDNNCDCGDSGDCDCSCFD